jgi:hypothetical protein
MGHFWRELDPGGAAEQDARIDRANKLRMGLKNISLSRFTVGELEAVMKLMGLFRNAAGQVGMHISDIQLLEAKLKKLRKPKPRHRDRFAGR